MLQIDSESICRFINYGKWWQWFCVYLQELFDAHEQFKSTLPEADKEFNAIMRLSQQAQSLSSSIGINNPENPYTTVNPQVGSDMTISCLVVVNYSSKLLIIDAV